MCLVEWAANHFGTVGKGGHEGRLGRFTLLAGFLVNHVRRWVGKISSVACRVLL